MNAPREQLNIRPLLASPDPSGSLQTKAPLRIMTAGSVDDGKSTLIGRLMFDLGLITDDILNDLRAASQRNGRGELDLSLFTDGLIAEREQGITIDVAYRYFRYQDRSFILCDSPGHVQYTRNMVCAASQADIALIMIDARQGPTEQSLRHLRIAQWLRVPAIVFAINKMDLVQFSEQRYLEIIEGLRPLLGNTVSQTHFEFVPVVAIDGDNVVARKPPVVAQNPSDSRMDWYRGPALFEVLNGSTSQAAFPANAPLRFTVQMVVRPTGKEAQALHDFRGLAGRVESGQLRPGDTVTLPHARGEAPQATTCKVLGIYTLDKDGLKTIDIASAGDCVTITLTEDLDVSRGDTLCHANSPAQTSRSLHAELCWMSETPVKVGQRILVKQGTRSSIAKVAGIESMLNLNSGQFEPSPGQSSLALNQIATVRLTLAQGMLTDAYAELPRTGSLLILDPVSYDSLAAGILKHSDC